MSLLRFHCRQEKETTFYRALVHGGTRRLPSVVRWAGGTLGLICPLLQLLWDRSSLLSFLYQVWWVIHVFLVLTIFSLCSQTLDIPYLPGQAPPSNFLPRGLNSSFMLLHNAKKAVFIFTQDTTSKRSTYLQTPLLLQCFCLSGPYQVRASLCGPNTTIPSGVRVTSYYSSAISCVCMLLLDLLCCERAGVGGG